jgi:LuxR family maltose regulon positive regulatory protein
VIRFELALCDGDLDALYLAAAEAEMALSYLPADVRAVRPGLPAWVLSSQGVAALWLGWFDDAVQILAEGTGDAAARGGHLALAEALRGRLGRAAELAARMISAAGEAIGPAAEPPPDTAADIALAWVHLERNELPQVRDSLRRAEAGLRTNRNRPAAALASLVAARLHLAEGRHAVAAKMLIRARHGWSVPPWLERRLAFAEARAFTMAGDTQAALDAADRCGDDRDFGAAAARSAAWMASGDITAAARALRPVLEAADDQPAAVLDPALLDILLADARIHYATGNRAAGHHSLARALRIGRSEDVRLPFAMERMWIIPVLRTDAELAAGYQALFHPFLGDTGQDALASLISVLEQSPVVEPLTGREQEVLRRVAQLMSTAEIANELYISVNTVKTHLKSVNRKLAVTDRKEAVRRARQLKLI